MVRAPVSPRRAAIVALLALVVGLVVAPPATAAPTQRAPFSQPAGVAAGWYVLDVELAGLGGRAEVTVGGERVAETATGALRTLSVPVRIDGPGQLVGVRSVGRPGTVVQARIASFRRTAPVLTTRGNKILGLDGKPWIPRGVVREGMQETAAGYRMSRADIAAIRSWGASIVRLKLSQHFWLPDMCTHDPAYAGRVDAAVEWITSQGMVVLLELARGTQGNTCGRPGFYPLADSASVRFWHDVARRYKDNPRVAFDLYNEPNNVNPEQWRNGARINGVYDGVGMQRLYDAVRSTGASNLVFVSGKNWAFDIRPLLTHPLDGHGIVAATHTYRLAGQGELRPDMDAAVATVAARLPVVITEFGWNRAGGDYNARLIEWAERHGVGWIAFQWSPWRGDTFSLLASWDSYAPNERGRPVFHALRRGNDLP